MHWRWSSRATVVLAIAIPLLWSFGSVLTGARVCAYRDSAHFYYPLYQWTSACWSRGEVPLWNPQDNIGSPVAAEVTSAVFYPGQLIFALPLSYSLKFNLYLVGHLGLAAVGAYALARQLLRYGNRRAEDSAAILQGVPDSELHQLAAALAAISYAFSGAVLFQYCNVVFLVGAAWLPFALLAADRMLTQRRLDWALALGVFLALMVLGGDPQMAYHAGLLAALLAWLRYRACGRERMWNSTSAPEQVPGRRPALLLLAIAAAVAILLSAVQIVPAIALMRSSERVVDDSSRSAAERLFGKPLAGTHQEQVYDFSVAPWRVVESFWPNVFGRMFPINCRWLSALRREGRVWTPTLYLGLLPLVIALTKWRLRSPCSYVSWLSLMAIGGLIASFGWYGIGWLTIESQRFWSQGPPTVTVGEPTGGLYWLMVKLLPGYAHFRYPAKLLTVASLAVSQLAGLGLEQSVTARRTQTLRWLAILGLASLAGAGAFAICGVWWSDWFVDALPDELFGPIDTRGSWLTCIVACSHAAIICGMFGWLLRRPNWPTVRLCRALVVVTALEIAWANGPLVLTAPADAMNVATVLDQFNSTNTRDKSTASCQRVERIYRPPRRRWVPRRWLASSDPQRGEQTVRWDRATMLPKYHLASRFGSIHSYNTMVSRDYRLLLRIAGDNHPHASVLNLLGVRYLVLPADLHWPGGTRVAYDSIQNVAVWENARAFPRSWVVHEVERWPSPRSSDPLEAEHRFHQLLFPQGHPRDLRQTAVVETRSWNPPLADGSHIGREVGLGESCQIVSERVCRVEIEATLTRPGLVVVATQYDDGWSVTDGAGDASHPLEIVRTNGVMQGVFLPEGAHHLVFHYVPRGFYAAGIISGISWLLCLLLVPYHGTRFVTRRAHS